MLTRRWTNHLIKWRLRRKEESLLWDNFSGFDMNYWIIQIRQRCKWRTSIVGSDCIDIKHGIRFPGAWNFPVNGIRAWQYVVNSKCRFLWTILENVHLQLYCCVVHYVVLPTGDVRDQHCVLAILNFIQLCYSSAIQLTSKTFSQKYCSEDICGVTQSHPSVPLRKPAARALSGIFAITSQPVPLS